MQEINQIIEDMKASKLQTTEKGDPWNSKSSNSTTSDWPNIERSKAGGQKSIIKHTPGFTSKILPMHFN